MSLLQEALKRKEDDEAQRKPEAVNAEKAPAALPPDDANLSAGRRETDGKNTFIPQDPPPQSMPVLAPPQSAEIRQPILPSAPALMLRNEESSRLGEAQVAKPGRRKTSLLWVVVAAIVILIGLTVAAGFTFFLYRCLSPVKAKIGQQVYHVDKTDTISAGGTNMAIGQPMPADGQKTADSIGTIPHQFAAPDVKNVEKDSTVTAARTQTVAIMQNAELNTVQQQSASDTTRKPVSTKPALLRAKTLIASSAAGRWPALKLTGILRGSGSAESTALINGKMISSGQTIDGVTVVEIQAAGVLLKHGAETRFLRVGATLY